MRKTAKLVASCLAAGLVLALGSGVHAGTPAVYLTSPLPPIQWQQSFGGTGHDTLWCLQQTAGGGFILGGSSRSVAGTGNKTSPNYGGPDFWVVRVDADGGKLWDKSFGGSDNDYLESLQQTSDGGFILGGWSSSLAGTGNKTSPNYGNYDFWVVRLDGEGNMLWDKSFGGSSIDYLLCLQQISDGGFILGGLSSSDAGTGNKTSPDYGGGDFWVVRLDAGGNKLWDKSFGGNHDEWLRSLQQTSDGGFILGGESYSATGTGNKTSPNYQGYDFWVVRLDADGNKLWDKSFGGSDHDELYSLQQTSDGGFIVGGCSESSGGTGNKTSPNYGGSDFWVVRLNAGGNKLWDKSFGGSNYDYLFSLQQTSDGGFILSGCSGSAVGTGNKTSPKYGSYDFWVVRLDAAGNKLWDDSFGGSNNDYLRSLQQTSEGGFVLGGYSESAAGTGNKTSPKYGTSYNCDLWVVKLDAGVVAVNEGETAAASGTFLDPDTTHTVTMTASIGTITQVGTNNGTWSWSYAATDGPSQSGIVTITASDVLDTTSMFTFNLVVNNVAPVFDAGNDTFVYVAPTGGAAFSRTITFTDPGTDVWSGSVNWGDGPDDEPLTIDQASKSFDLNHTYTTEGAYAVTVTVNDDDGGTCTDTFVVQSDWSVIGDVNGDCTVDIFDAIFIRSRFGSNSATGDNWRADVNADGRINILDLIFVRKRLNTQCP